MHHTVKVHCHCFVCNLAGSFASGSHYDYPVLPLHLSPHQPLLPCPLALPPLPLSPLVPVYPYKGSLNNYLIVSYNPCRQLTHYLLNMLSDVFRGAQLCPTHPCHSHPDQTQKRGVASVLIASLPKMSRSICAGA